MNLAETLEKYPPVGCPNYFVGAKRGRESKWFCAGKLIIDLDPSVRCYSKQELSRLLERLNVWLSIIAATFAEWFETLADKQVADLHQSEWSFVQAWRNAREAADAYRALINWRIDP